MAAYLVVDADLTHPDVYEQYKLKAKPLVEQYGGEYLARGGQVSRKENLLWSPTRLSTKRFRKSASNRPSAPSLFWKGCESWPNN